MAKEPEIIGSLVVEITTEHSLRIHSEGNVSPQDLLMASAFITRTANQLLDAAAYQAAQATDPKGIEVVQAIPDALKVRQ